MQSHHSTDRTSSRILYHCRMRYLKSRDSRSRKQTSRRKSSLDLLDFSGNDDSDEPHFSCLKVRGPCTPEILLPPSELMTRPVAFKQSYWQHHFKPTIRSLKKLEVVHLDERKERLEKKRREILAKIRLKEKAKREKDLRRRADRVMNHHHNSSSVTIESEESGDDETESELEEQLSMMSLSPSKLSSRSNPPASSSPSRRKLRASLAVPRSGEEARDSHSHADTSKEDEEDSEANNSFSFLSEWASTPQEKLRW